MKLEKLDFKKKKCWVFVCKKCHKEVEEGDYTPHFTTKTEAYEHLDDEGGEDYFSLSCDCVFGVEE